MRDTRPISWIKGALKDFDAFPDEVQSVALGALTIAAESRKADIAKPLKGLGSGIFEIVLRHRGDAFRVVYTVQFGDAVWVVHAFQKKSKKGVATPRPDIELIKARLKRLKELLE
jgi:phage-related protein